MGINTKIILMPCIVTEILTKEGFSVMAALICILGGLPKDDRVASFRFLKRTPWRYGNCKITLYGRHCTLIGRCHHTNYACSRHRYNLFFAHIPFVVNRVFSAKPAEWLQHHYAEL